MLELINYPVLAFALSLLCLYFIAAAGSESWDLRSRRKKDLSDPESREPGRRMDSEDRRSKDDTFLA
ncbi:MAG: hypothetical protein ACREV3_01540 [Gammaproteobacteria bacterium]